jgi:hypothetical protein
VQEKNIFRFAAHFTIGILPMCIRSGWILKGIWDFALPSADFVKDDRNDHTQDPVDEKRNKHHLFLVQQ